MWIEPLYDRVVIKRVDEEETTVGGIIIPETAKEKPIQGIIKMTGAEAKGVKAGQRVLFGKYAGTEIEIDQEELLIMREEDIIGIVHEGNKPGLTVLKDQDMESFNKMNDRLPERLLSDPDNPNDTNLGLDR